MGLLDPGPSVGDWGGVPPTPPAAKAAAEPKPVAAKPVAAKPVAAPVAEPAAPPPAEPKPLPAPNGRSDLQGALANMRTLEDFRHERPAPKPNLPDKPKTAVDDIQMWGALAIAFAGFASLRTRAPMTTALNAAGAAMAAMQEGAKDRVDQAFKEWKENTEIALRMHDYEMRVWEDWQNEITNRQQWEFNGAKSLNDDKWRAIELDFKTRQSVLGSPAGAVWEKAKQEGKDPVQAVIDFNKMQDDYAKQLDQAKLGVQRAKVGGSMAAVTQQAIADVESTPAYSAAKQAGDIITMNRLIMERIRALRGKEGFSEELDAVRQSAPYLEALARKDNIEAARLLALTGGPEAQKKWMDLVQKDKGIAATDARQDKSIAAALNLEGVKEKDREAIAKLTEEQRVRLFDMGAAEREKLFGMGAAEREKLFTMGADEREKLFGMKSDQQAKVLALSQAARERLWTLKADQQLKVLDLSEANREKFFGLRADEQEKMFRLGADEREKLLNMNWEQRKAYLDENTAARKLLMGVKLEGDEALAAQRMGGVQRNLNDLEKDPEFQKLDPVQKISKRAEIMAKSSPQVWMHINKADVDPKEVEATADMVGTYRLHPLSGYVLSTDFGKAYLAKLAEKYPGYDDTDYNLINRTRQEIQNGKTGATVQSLQKIVHHLELYENLVKQVKAAGITDLNAPVGNKIAAWFSQQAGLPEVTNLDTANRFIAEEVTTFMAGASGGTETGRQEHKEPLKIQSLDQMEGAVDTIRQLMLGQADGILTRFHAMTENGWMKPTDIIPEKTLAPLLKATGQSPETRYPTGTNDNNYKGIQDIKALQADIDREAAGGSKAGGEQAPAGMSHHRFTKDGREWFSPTGDDAGPWYDKDGNLKK